MKTEINMALSHTWRAPIPTPYIMLASDEECNQVISNCLDAFEDLQEFMSSIVLLDKTAIHDSIIVTNCTTQLKEMMINCERRLGKTERDYIPTTDVYTTSKANEGRKRG